MAAPSGAGTSIHQEVDFNASPVASARAERIYEALLDEKQFSAFSGASARIHREAGGVFTLFGGRVTGRNIELIPNQRIVQAWRVETWPAGVYSISSRATSSGGEMTIDSKKTTDFRLPTASKRPPRAVVDGGGGTIIAVADVDAPPERVFRALTTDEVERW